MIGKSVVFALVFLVAINANPIKVDHKEKGKTYDEISSEEIDQRIIEFMISNLKRRGVDVEGFNIHDDKVTLIKAMLKRRITLPQAIETLSEPEKESSSSQKAEKKKKFQERITQLKDTRSQNFRRSEPKHQGNSEKLQLSSMTKPFKVPEYIKLPQKFALKHDIYDKPQLGDSSKSI